MKEETTARAFKTEWFTKAANKAKISDADLCKAIKQVKLGQCDDLGGGIFKKRLNKNMHRSIVVAKGGKYWVYAFLFAKKDRDNIDDKELAGFRELADLYASKTDNEIKKELEIKVLVIDTVLILDNLDLLLNLLLLRLKLLQKVKPLYKRLLEPMKLRLTTL